MKSIFVVLLLVYGCLSCKAQPGLLLTKAQMMQDFDTLYKNIIETSPQYNVRLKVTGHDIKKDLALIRRDVSNCKTDKQFLYCVQRALTLCQDGHTSLIWTGYLPSREDYTKLGISSSAIDLMPHYDSLWRTNPATSRKFSLPLTYLSGEYYTLADFSFNNQDFKAGSKLVTCNGRPIHLYVKELYPYKRMMRWDFKNSRYFAEDFFLASNLTAADSLLLEFERPDGKKQAASFSLAASLRFADTINATANKTKKVEYWEKEKLLYIRVPTMSEPDYYPALIQSLAANKPLAKVIIDIRDNPGGGDGVWINILSTLIREPINYTDFILCNNSNVLKTRFPEESRNWKPYTEPLFKNDNYLVFYSGAGSIEPDSASIRYNGPIYVLQNENIYSSAGSLAAVAVLSPQLITVGNNTGRLLGKGVSPLLFELPHSKILYRIEPVIDFLNVKVPEDVYHDQVELPVPLSISEYLDRLKFKDSLYTKDFLLEKDPVFRKIVQDTQK